MHNLTPHNHNDLQGGEMLLESNSDDADLFSILSSCFHHDLGDGHLEHLIVADNLLPDFVLGGHSVQDSDIICMFEGIEDTDTFSFTDCYSPPISFYNSYNNKASQSLRAPPC